MSTGALNTDAINVLGFPGAEAASAIIELSTVAQATCAMSALYLLRAATATTTAEAQCPPPTARSKISNYALLTATASASATARTKLKTVPDAVTAQAGTSATVGRCFRFGAASSGVAFTSIVAYVRASRAAQTDAVAAVSVNLPKSKISFGATATAQVTSAVDALRKLRMRADPVPAAATSSANTSVRAASPAVTTASALGTAGRYIKTRSTAVVTARALSPVAQVKYKILLSPVELAAQAVTTPIASQAKISTSASQFAAAVGEARASVRLRTGAQTTASVTSATAAIDFAATLPAPIERQMTLDASTRRVEVTQ